MTCEDNRPCPDQKELPAFAVSDLDDERLEQLAVHLDDCELCGIVMDEFPIDSHSGLVAEDLCTEHQSSKVFQLGLVFQGYWLLHLRFLRHHLRDRRRIAFHLHPNDSTC